MSSIPKKRLFLAMAVTVVFSYIFFSRTDITYLITTLKYPDYRMVIPAVILYMISMLWRTVRFHILLQSSVTLPFSKTWSAMSIGYAINNILPIRIGDLVRIYLASQYQRTSKSSVLATIVTERISDGVIIMILVGFAAPVVPLIPLFQGLGAQVNINWLVFTLGLSLPFFLVFAAVLILIFRPETSHGFLKIIDRFCPNTISITLGKILLGFNRGLSTLRTSKGILILVLVSFPIWLSEFGVYVVLAYGFGIDDHFLDLKTLLGSIVLVGAIANLGTNIPSSNGGIGTFEFFSHSALLFFGVDPTIGAIYVVAVHATIILPITLIGIGYIALGNLSLFSLINKSQST